MTATPPAAGASPEHDTVLTVAIDGPAGSGKSTVAAMVADALAIPHIDTGALYRAAALACLRASVPLDDPDACARVVRAHTIERVDGRTLLDGDDVEDEIRGEAATAAVGLVSAHGSVRDALGPAQRAMARRAGGVIEGRDIGTVVLADAHVKVFLTASVTERARRRAAQLGRDDVETFVASIEERDHLDATREVAPLQRADDAIEIDTTGMTIDEVVARIVDLALDRPNADKVDAVTLHRRLPRIVVVGRPNVGKSTFVNRIIGHRAAIVEERPGVTRDFVEYPAEWSGRRFVVVDTGGWEHGAGGMAARIAAQAEAAIRQADAVVLVVDVMLGVLDDDERYARQLRRLGRPVLLVANKVDGPRQEPAVHELYRLGLGDPQPVSARTGRGMGDVLDAMIALVPDAPDLDAAVADPLPRVSIVGRPNVGKSSLFNRLAGSERSLVDPVPHTTRDAVDTVVELDGRPWVFVDTAGMRRRYRHGEATELYAVDRTRASIAQSDLVLFVIDSSEPIGEQDQRLAALLRDAGRGIVLVCNKWDRVDEDRRHELDAELDRLLGFAAWAPRVRVSASTGRGIRRLAGHLAPVFDNFHRRVPTRELNRLVEDAVAMHAPPRQGNRPVKIRYVTQAETAPPRLILFANGRIDEGYRRYLERILREHYEFTGVPLLIDDRASARRRRGRR